MLRILFRNRISAFSSHGRLVDLDHNAQRRQIPPVLSRYKTPQPGLRPLAAYAKHRPAAQPISGAGHGSQSRTRLPASRRHTASRRCSDSRALTYSGTFHQCACSGLNANRVFPTICVHICSVSAVALHSAHVNSGHVVSSSHCPGTAISSLYLALICEQALFFGAGTNASAPATDYQRNILHTSIAQVHRPASDQPRPAPRPCLHYTQSSRRVSRSSLRATPRHTAPQHIHHCLKHRLERPLRLPLPLRETSLGSATIRTRILNVLKVLPREGTPEPPAAPDAR